MNRIQAAKFLGRLITGPESPEDREQVNRRLRGAMPWELLVDVAGGNLITPALHTALSSLDEYKNLPEDLRTYLAYIHRLNRSRDEDVQSQVCEISRLFNQIGVEPVLLKGAANLFLDIYRDPADRIMHDVDVLVPKEKLSECTNILKENGYRGILKNFSFTEESPHFFILVSRERPVGVELHQYTLPKQYATIYTDRDLARESVRQSVADAVFRLPSPPYHLLHHVCHAHKHWKVYGGPAQNSLRFAVDFTLLCRFYGDQIDWIGIEKRFEAGKLRNALAAYLLATKELCGFGDPLARVGVSRAKERFLRGVFFLFRFHPVFGACKLFHEYRLSIKAMAADPAERIDFLKKLNRKEFYARQGQRLMGIFKKEHALKNLCDMDREGAEYGRD
ncbi:MAG TPA: nucleotidyltransferase family protein [Syntrophobacteraceae bacterium]|nr:nucleotidyltransferase family protein [Syntrophobacteraceae bacterium]